MFRHLLSGLNHYPKLLCLSALYFGLSGPVNAACTGNDLGGHVYRDFNANGTQDSNEPGFGATGMQVIAYDAANLPVQTAAIALDGSYTLAGLGDGTPYRLEFTGLPDYLQYGAIGNNSIGGVHFVSGSSCSITMSVNNASDYCQADPIMAAPIMDSGSGIGNTFPGLLTFPYSTSGLQSTTPATPVSTADEMGSTYGQGWQRQQRRSFVSAYLRRHVGFADGPGYVYAFDFPVAGTPATYSAKFDLQGVTPANGGASIDLGSINRTNISDTISNGPAGDFQLSNNPDEPTRDMDAYAKVGKMSFGDIDISEDDKTLWLVNMFQRALISIDISGTTSGLPGTVNQYIINDLTGAPACSNGEFRPAALTFNDGKGYLGGVCDAAYGTASDLKGIILSFDPANVAGGFSTPLNIPLDGNRGWGANSEYTFHNWKPWNNAWTEPPIEVIPDGASVYAHPMLTDMEFLADGSLVIGIRDRFSDLVANHYKAISGNTQIANNFSFGDTLMACNVDGVLHLEGTDTDPYCPGKFYTDWVNTWEYFRDSSGDANAEGSAGSLAYSPIFTDIALTFIDPQPPANDGAFDPDYASSRGIHKNNTGSGAQTDWYQLLHKDNNTLSKANGLGDIELYCYEAPIEVGNRVWKDTNSNGIQDADEAGIASLNVGLTCGSDTTTTQTDSQGHFLFTNASGGNAGFMSRLENW